MDIKEIVNRINENSRLLADGSISEIERDILLEDLRRLYLLAKSDVLPVRHVTIEQPKATVIETKPIIAVKEEVIAPPVVEQKPIEIVEVVVPKEEPKQQ